MKRTPPLPAIQSLKEWRKQTKRTPVVPGKRSRALPKELEPIYPQIGSIIKEMRERLGITQREISEALGMSQGHFLLVERGKVRVMAHHLIILSRVIRIPVQEFFEADDEDEAETDEAGDGEEDANA